MQKIIVNLLFLALFITNFPSCRSSWQQSEIKSQQYTISNKETADPKIEAIIKPYREELSKAMDVVIGQNDVLLLKERPEGTLNNFVGDLLYEMTLHHYGPIDFATANYGGLRIPSIPTGPVTLGKIYELMPFDNQITILKMKGDLLQQLLDRIAERRGWAISKHLRFQISNDKAINVTINGEPLTYDKIYTISIPDYIANGGDGCDFLEAAERTDLSILVRDAMIAFIKMKTAKNEAISAQLDGRIAIKN
ncbi:MAG: 5'-nucleotidase C-terminal domain-containing protein [Saprospiraceae bacterium]